MQNVKVRAVSRAGETSVEVVCEAQAVPLGSEDNLDLGLQPL